MERDRSKTEEKILRAFAELLAEKGFGATGVNAVARKAGVDKVLIYRYFDGVPGLLAAFAEREEFWPSIESLTRTSTGEALDSDCAPAELAKTVLINYIRTLRERPVTREIIRWELIERNELTEALGAHRERQGIALLERFGTQSGVDLPALASVLYAGIVYLVLRAKTVDVFNGIDITSSEGWDRIERAVAFLVEATMGENTSGHKTTPS